MKTSKINTKSKLFALVSKKKKRKTEIVYILYATSKINEKIGLEKIKNKPRM